MPMHDVFPQWFNLNIAKEAVLETLVEVETAMPVRIGERQVMEILGILWNINAGGAPAPQEKTVQFQAQLTKRAAGITSFDLVPKNNIIDWVGFREIHQFTTSGAGQMVREQVIWHDFASGGHGFLLASQSIFLQVVTTIDAGAAQLGSASVRMLYKLVQVSAEELIGLVQE